MRLAFTSDLAAARHHPRSVASRDQLLFTPQSASCHLLVLSFCQPELCSTDSALQSLQRLHQRISVVWKPRPAGALCAILFCVSPLRTETPSRAVLSVWFKIRWDGFAERANQNYSQRYTKTTGKYKLRECQRSPFSVLNSPNGPGRIQDSHHTRW